MSGFLATLICLMLSPSQADAAFVGLAITAISNFAAGGILQAFLVRTGLAVALSALGRLARGRQSTPGISTEVTTNGGVTPQKLIVGRYATGGQLIAPPMSYGSVGGTPLAYLVYDIAVSAAERATLSRVIINDNYVTLGAPGASWGKPVTGDLAGYAWVDFRDGTQTTALPDLMAAFGSDPTRPWSSDMIGRGVGEAVLRFRYDRERMNNLPNVTFELLGIPLYDPRADTSIGGTGTQRWDTPATWTQTENPVVIIYNIMRGIVLEDGSVWGGSSDAEDLPLSSWMAAMNECDVAIALEGGGTEPQFRCGYEISLDQEPQDVINELKKVASAEMAEFGGIWKIRVGPPALPIYFFTDDDILITTIEELDAFPGLANTFNGVEASYPEPESLWKPKDAPARYNATWEAEDGGQRLIAGLQFPACPYQTQVQRIMSAAIKDERRYRRHNIPLPPSAAILEPLDTASWTSARNGYAAKLFEIAGITDTLMTARQYASIRECDPADYTWLPGDALSIDFSPVGPAVRPAQTVLGFDLQPLSIADSGGGDRRPALKLVWDPAAHDGVRGLEYEVRVTATGMVISRGTITTISAGDHPVSSGVLAGVNYQARMQPIADWPTAWTAWEAATAPVLLINTVDIYDGAVSGAVLLKKTFATQTISSTSSSSPDVVSGTERTGLYNLVTSKSLFQQLRFDGADCINPIEIEVALNINAPVGPAQLRLNLQYLFVGGLQPWQNNITFFVYSTVISAMATHRQDMKFGFLIDGDNPDAWDGLRIVAYVTGGSPYSGRVVQINNLFATVRQINR